MRAATLVGVWAAMLVLLAISVGGTFLPIGAWRQAISLGVAAIKAALILWFFMDLRRSEGLARLAGAGAVTFLTVMIALFAADYLTRGWLSD